MVEAVAQKFKTGLTLEELASASSQAIGIKVDGDSDPRIKLDAGGKITWGAGDGTGDGGPATTIVDGQTVFAIVRNPQAEPVKSIDFRGPEHQRDPRFVVERFFRTRRLEDFHIDRVVGPGRVAHEQTDIGGQPLLDQFPPTDLPVASRGVVLELGDQGADLANLLFELGTSLSLLWRAD